MVRRSMGVMIPFLLFLAGCGTEEGTTTSSPGGAAASEYWFDSLPRMVAIPGERPVCLSRSRHRRTGDRGR